MKVLFFLRRIGPYHHARFEAAARILTLIAVETRPASMEYPWVFDRPGEFQVEKFPLSEDPETGIRGATLKDTVNSLLSKHHPDVIVTTGWADPEYHVCVLAAREIKCPIVVISDSRYEDEPRKFHKEIIKRILVKSFSSALVAGKSSRNYLLKLGFDDRSIFQPWDVVDNDHFQQPAKTAPWQERPFICVSRFVQKKNIEGLIDAYALYRKEGGKRDLHLVGSGPLESQFRSQVRSCSIGDHVVFHDFMQYDTLPGALAGALCLILASFTDQWGLVVNEAMAAGLPVLVSDRCGCAVDLVQNSVNGYIFDPFDKKAIVQRMNSLEESEDKWKRMSSASTDIIKNWTPGRFAHGLLSACNYAASHPSRISYSVLHKMLGANAT